MEFIIVLATVFVIMVAAFLGALGEYLIEKPMVKRTYLYPQMGMADRVMKA